MITRTAFITAQIAMLIIQAGLYLQLVGIYQIVRPSCYVIETQEPRREYKRYEVKRGNEVIFWTWHRDRAEQVANGCPEKITREMFLYGY